MLIEGVLPIKPLRYLMCNLCEKHDLVNVVDALILALQEQQEIISSKNIQNADTKLTKVIHSLEEARQDALDIPWR